MQWPLRFARRFFAALPLLLMLGAACVGQGCGRVGLELLAADVAEIPAAEAGAPEDGGEPDPSSCSNDGDADGVCDAQDNCPTVRNVNQRDIDADGKGDSCDADRDDDGLPNDVDPCPASARNDEDADGICDATDMCLGGDDGSDTDGDGTPDHCDACPNDAADDSDGDGVCDESDVCPAGNDRNDADGDSRPDACDACPLEPSKSAPDVCGCAVSPRPIARYPFDESSGLTARDVRGSHPGMLIDFSGTPWAAGALGNALSFDGTDDYVQIGAVSARVRSLAF